MVCDCGGVVDITTIDNYSFQYVFMGFINQLTSLWGTILYQVAFCLFPNFLENWDHSQGKSPIVASLERVSQFGDAYPFLACA